MIFVWEGFWGIKKDNQFLAYLIKLCTLIYFFFIKFQSEIFVCEISDPQYLTYEEDIHTSIPISSISTLISMYLGVTNSKSMNC